jgi:hypothetical protein
MEFNFDFPCYAVGDVELYVGNEQWKFSEDYGVSLVADAGGWVTLLKEPPDGALLTIVGATPYVRTETYVPPTPDVAALNAECTKTVQRLQQLHRDISGCLKNSREETEAGNTELPNSLERRGKLATWGTETGQLIVGGDGGSPGKLAAPAGEGQWLLANVVAESGPAVSWLRPGAIEIPPATGSTLGGMMVGSGLAITAAGMLSVAATTDQIAEGETHKYNVQADWNAGTGAAAILNRPANVLQSLVAGAGISVDSSDPANPSISATSASGGDLIDYAPNFIMAAPNGVFSLTPPDSITIASGLSVIAPNGIGADGKFSNVALVTAAEIEVQNTIPGQDVAVLLKSDGTAMARPLMGYSESKFEPGGDGPGDLTWLDQSANIFKIKNAGEEQWQTAIAALIGTFSPMGSSADIATISPLPISAINNAVNISYWGA